MAQHRPWSPTRPPSHFEPGDRGTSIEPSWLLPVLGHTLGAAAMGGILGALVLKNLLSGFGWFGAWGQTTWFWVLVGAALGGTSGLTRGLRLLRRKQHARRLAAQRTLSYSEHGDNDSAQRLKTILGRDGFVSLENVLSGEHDGLKLLFGDLVYIPTGSKNSHRRVSSIASFQHSELSFPQFTLQPEGSLLNMMAGIVGVEDIDFDSHPEFSRRYHLSGQEPESVRQLFQPRLLDFLEQRPGWQVRGERNCLVILRPRQAADAAGMEAFMDEAQAMFSEFEQATRTRARMAPPLPRQSSPAGSLIELARRQAITPAEVEQFLQSAAPREVPRRILFQYLNGSIWVLAMLFGFLVVLGGCLAAGGFAGREPVLLLVGSAIVAVALSVLAWIVHRRQRKFHLLTHGCRSEGRIERVDATPVAINGQQRYLALVHYHADGLPYSAKVPLYGSHVELARDAADESRSVPLLYDPGSPQRVVLSVQLVTQFRLRL